MGIYTKIDKQLDNYYEIVDLNEKLSKQNYYLKICILLLFVCYIFVFMKCLFNLFIILSFFSLEDILFKFNFPISSITS